MIDDLINLLNISISSLPIWMIMYWLGVHYWIWWCFWSGCSLWIKWALVRSVANLIIFGIVISIWVSFILFHQTTRFILFYKITTCLIYVSISSCPIGPMMNNLTTGWHCIFTLEIIYSWLKSHLRIMHTLSSCWWIIWWIHFILK